MTEPIPALIPRGSGHQFVLAADACSGVPGAPHEEAHARVNEVIARLDPLPEFIAFPGDEIIGLTDTRGLRAQWDHWLGTEMAWAREAGIPVWNTTGNHTAWSPESARIMGRALSHLPWERVPDRMGYTIRHGDLALVCVDTLSGPEGGEGHADTGWLDHALADLADARWRFVAGHHPVFPVNGFAGPPGRTLEPGCGADLWQVLRRHRVTAYLCSHILAFDVQAQGGVLQICSGGAGTVHRMPEGAEYLHAVQIAVDGEGLRYQVLDDGGQLRERLDWPVHLPDPDDWAPLGPGRAGAPISGRGDALGTPAQVVALSVSGRTALQGGDAQTLLCGVPEGGVEPFWIGLTGPEQRLTIALAPEPGRSPHYWTGPEFARDVPIELHLAFHSGMGPGGVLWRLNAAMPWTSCAHTSAWGAERIDWSAEWITGHDANGDRPFRGQALEIRCSIAG